MKKFITVIAVLATLIIGATLLTACGTQDTQSELQKEEEYKQSAINAALNDLGANVNQVQSTVVTSDTKKGEDYYDVELVIDGINYKYRIKKSSNGITGVLINDQVVDNAKKPLPPFNPHSNSITLDAAKTVAFTDAGAAAADVTDVKAKFDFDDGQYLYEIEFKFDGKEYEYDIISTDGTIYKKDVDGITVIEPTPEQGSYIGIEAAKNIALADAKLTEAEFDTVDMERNKGVMVYEVEFVSNGVEYEYKINATTGAIIKSKNGSDSFPSTPEGYIKLENAKTIALNHAGLLAENVVFSEASLKVDRGVYLYEIEFKADGYEYEYKIHAVSGDIIKAQKELDD